MNQILRVFMNKQTLIDLEDHFIDDEKTNVKRFFHESLRELAKTSKLADSTRSFKANVIEDGIPKQEVFQYKDVDLEKYTLTSDPNWRPDNIDETEMEIYQMKVGEKTHNHLIKYCKIYGVRLQKFNDSVPKVKKMEDGKEVEIPDPRYTIFKFPTCFEEVIHNALADPIEKLLITSAQEIFDKEFDEIEKEEKELVAT